MTFPSDPEHLAFKSYPVVGKQSKRTLHFAWPWIIATFVLGIIIGAHLT